MEKIIVQENCKEAKDKKSTFSSVQNFTFHILGIFLVFSFIVLGPQPVSSSDQNRVKTEVDTLPNPKTNSFDILQTKEEKNVKGVLVKAKARASGTDASLDVHVTVYCPAKKLNSYDDTYGEFELPRTVASEEQGTFILSPCPHGSRTTGAVLIYNRRLFDVISPAVGPTPTPVISPGLQSYCVLEWDEKTNTSLGMWRHVNNASHVANCRQQVMADLVKEVRAVVPHEETITPFNLKQAIPLLNSLLRNAYKDYESARALVDSISRLLAEPDIFVGATVQVMRDELFRLLEQYTKNARISPGEKVSLTSDGISVETAIFPSDIESVVESEQVRASYSGEKSETEGEKRGGSTYMYDFESIHLPLEAIQMARSGLSIDQQPRVQLVAYSNELFFHWGKDRAWDLGNLTEPQESSEFTGNYRVLSMKFDGVTIENLTEPIVYTLPANQPVNNSMRWVCVFWDETESKWSSRGMKSIKLSNGTMQCEANHLTAFSILLDPRPTAEEYYDEYDEEDMAGNPGYTKEGDPNASNTKNKKKKAENSIHTHVLSVLSSIGSALSMTGLAITVLTFALFRSLRKERSNRILLNMSVSLFFLHLMSLLSEAQLWSRACFVPSFLLHYLLLSSIAWMTVEAVHMYNLLISVFVKPQARFILKRSIFAWGVPLLIVTICSCVHPEVYTSGRGEWCIMAGHLNYWMYYCAYLAPAAIMLGINSFIFVRILKVLCVQSANMRKQTAIMSKNNHIHKQHHRKNLDGGFDEKKFDGGTQKQSHDHNHNQNQHQRLDTIKSTSFLRISPTQVKGAITVSVLLGVGWTLGFFAIGKFKLVFEYLFCLCNSSQGVLIFLFRVLLHPQASRVWRKALTSFDSRSDLTSFYKRGHSHSNSNSHSQSHSQSNNQSQCQTPSSPTFLSPATSANNTLTKEDRSSSKLAETLASILNSPPPATSISISISPTTPPSEK